MLPLTLRSEHGGQAATGLPASFIYNMGTIFRTQGGSIQKTSHMRHWAVLIACCLLVGAGFTIPMLSFSVFIAPMVAYFGCSVTEVSIYFTFTAAAAVLSSAIGDRLLRKSMRVTVIVFSCAMGLAYLALAVFPSVHMVWVAGIVCGLGFPFCSTVLVPIAINNWFAVRQGTYIGIAFAMVGVFGMLYSPFFTAIIGAAGWRVCLVVAAIILVAIDCLVAVFLLRQHPSRLGLEALGAESAPTQLAEEAPEAQEAQEAEEIHVIEPSAAAPVPKGILTRRAFWLCAVVALLGGIFGTFNSQLNAAAQASGFDPMVAGLALSSASAGLMVGKLFMGWLKDFKGSAVAIVFGCTMGVIAFAVTSFGIATGNKSMLYLGAALAGFCTCLATLSAAFLSSAAFEPAAYARAVAYLTAFCNLGMAIGVPFYSLSYDILGSYLPMFIACTVLPIACAFVAIMGIRAGKSEQVA